MSDGMTHDDAREALEALALDALDASERDAVLAHVAGCATCQQELVALEQTVGQLALAVTPLPMPPAQRDRMRARLLARAAADRASSDSFAPPARADVALIRRATPRRGVGPAVWMAIAASVVAILGVGAFVQARRERDSLREALQTAAAERGARAEAMDSLRTSLADKDRMIANLTGPQVKVMTLASASPTSPVGQMFWDQTHDAWTFVAHRVPMPKTGRTYQLWLVTPTAKISAGTFMPSPNGEVMMRATYALAKDSLAAVAVTEEPGGGSPQPTTAPVMIAAK
jgi:hypothetical protein